MGFGGFIFTIMVLIFIVSGIKRMMEALGREAQKNAPRGRGFEASASEVQEFLRNLQEARRQQTQVQVGQGRLRAPVRQGMRPGAPVPPEAPFWLGEPPGQANEEGPAVPVARPVRVRRRGAGRHGTRQRKPAPGAEGAPAGDRGRPEEGQSQGGRHLVGDTRAASERAPQAWRRAGQRAPVTARAPG
jgi:hypothetical protein